MTDPTDFSCPLPVGRYARITLAHGGGGRLMHDLIAEVFAPAFANPRLDRMHDGALLDVGAGRVAMTTDGYVVQPLEFPGGDIGKLAVCGTVNDLAMCGARPRWLSAGFILEEGLELATLRRVVTTMAASAREAGVEIVTGDTKVIERARGDGMQIVTAGIGVVPDGVEIGPERVRPGDAILLSGDVGRHGVAIMARRQGLAFATEIESDCAPLNGLVADMLAAGDDIHCLRDLTRGGLATSLIEIAAAARCGLTIEEPAIPVMPAVAGASELLGLDPLFIANEGRLVAFVAPAEADAVLASMREHPHGAGACRIGEVGAAESPADVIVRTAFGTRRVLTMPSGEQLPRIC